MGGGAGATLDQIGGLLGRELGPADVEPLTWRLAEIGRERSAARYLGDVALHQTAARAVAAWHESGFDLLLTPTTGVPPQPLGTYDDSGPDPLDALLPRDPRRRLHGAASTRPGSRRSRCRCT